jgi:hypothetical protein
VDEAPSKARATIRAARRRLDEDEQRGRRAERDVHAEQNPHRPGTSYESRVESAHALSRSPAEPRPRRRSTSTLVEQDDRVSTTRNDRDHGERVVRGGAPTT